MLLICMEKQHLVSSDYVHLNIKCQHYLFISAEIQVFKTFVLKGLCSVLGVFGPQPHLITCLFDFFSILSYCLSFSFNLASLSLLFIRPGVELIQIRLLSGHGHSHRLDWIAISRRFSHWTDRLMCELDHLCNDLFYMSISENIWSSRVKRVHPNTVC